ncbi:MAG: hypothetical protein IJF32_07350, partial [Oscillospiraceae bacterium]|nr:hypothetical protein [Oscillospiraceae bacterium]
MKRTKKLTAMILALVMVISLIPATSADVGDVLTFNYAVDQSDCADLAAKQTKYNSKKYYWPDNGASVTEATTAYIDTENSSYKSDWAKKNQPWYTYDNKTYYFYHMRQSKGKCWPNDSQAAAFKVKVPGPGTYKITQSSLNYEAYSGDVAIYINGQYAGAEYTTGFVSGSTEYTELNTQLNTLTLTPDEKNFVDIVFRPIGRYYDGGCTLRIYPIETVFTPVAESTLSDISYDIEKTEILLGESQEISASALMSDGTLHHFADYDATGKADTYDSIEITQLDGTDFVELSEVQTKSDKITAKITAKEKGTATIKIAAKIGEGDPIEKTVTITATTPPKLASVTLSADKETLPAGRQAKL